MSVFTQQTKVKLVIYHCMSPLFIGSIFYLLFRSTELRIFKWLSILGLDGFVYRVRLFFTDVKVFIPDWMYYSLPDGLWIYSFTSALLIYWNNDIEKVKHLLLIPFLTGVLIEVFQGLKIFEGTFDFLDLTFSITGFILSIFIINYKIKKNE